MTALTWKNIVHGVCSAKFQARNLLFGLQPTCVCFYTQAFWICMVHTLNKRFRGKVMCLVGSAQSFKPESTFWSSATLWVLLHASIFAVRDPYTEQALSWGSFVSCGYIAKFQTQNLLCRPSDTTKVLLHARVFWLSVVHTLNKRFLEKAMFLVWTAQCSKHGIYFMASRQHAGAFTRKHSGCAWSIRWTSAFAGK